MVSIPRTSSPPTWTDPAGALGAAWLGECGWAFTGQLPLAGPISLVTAEAV